MKRCCWNLFRPRGFCLKRFRSGPAAVGKISDANADSVLERVKGGAREIFLWRVRLADTQKDFDTNGKAPIFASEIRPHLLAAGPFGDVSPYPFCFVLKDVDRVPWSVFRMEGVSRCIKKGEQPPDVCVRKTVPLRSLAAPRGGAGVPFRRVGQVPCRWRALTAGVGWDCMFFLAKFGRLKDSVASDGCTPTSHCPA